MGNETMSWIAGVDVGGTFTDLIAIDTASGAVRLAKVPTTPQNQAFGVLAAIESAGLDLAELALIVHGTTTTTNALLERKLAKTGLITTKGFRDVLELGRRTRPNSYGLTGWFEPLVPRELRLEVAERVDADGNVLTPLDEDAVRRTVRQLKDAGCEALVIHFLHSYINHAHEARRLAIAKEIWPNSYVTAGHLILSEYREYERGVTAAVNASVQPILDRYIGRLVEELRSRGFARDLLVMQGNGGTVAAGLVAETAVNTVMSGPASGIIAAAYSATASGVANVITYDMGGTSTDVGLIKDGVPTVSAELEIEYAMPIHVPMVDVHTIGAGGGSIAFTLGRGHAPGGAEERGRDARADLLRARRRRADDHRCQPAAGPVESGKASGSRQPGQPRARQRHLRIAHRQCAGAGCDRRRGGNHPHCQRQDGGRDPHGVPCQGPRSARLRAVSFRRRRAAARRGAREGARHPEAADPDAAGHHQCPGLRGRRPAPRLRQHRQQAAALARRGARESDARGADRRRPRHAWTRRRRDRGREAAALRRHAVPGPEPHPHGGRFPAPKSRAPSCRSASMPPTTSASASSCRRSAPCS